MTTMNDFDDNTEQPLQTIAEKIVVIRATRAKRDRMRCSVVSLLIPEDSKK